VRTYDDLRDLAGSINELISEVDQLRERNQELSFRATDSATHIHQQSVVEQLQQNALEKLWGMLSASNQTEAVQQLRITLDAVWEIADDLDSRGYADVAGLIRHQAKEKGLI
jgi:hypothetical protein